MLTYTYSKGLEPKSYPPLFFKGRKCCFRPLSLAMFSYLQLFVCETLVHKHCFITIWLNPTPSNLNKYSFRIAYFLPHTTFCLSVLAMDFPRKLSLFRSPYAYSKLEDKEEKTHERARLLIFKILEQTDSHRGASCLKIRIFSLKVKIRKRITKLKKCISCKYI